MYLNTSYVDIKRQKQWKQQTDQVNLNTSYVDIKHDSQLRKEIDIMKFKYILCWY